MVKKVLCISNGHGEDRISAYIGSELSQRQVSVTALPLVGGGHAYQAMGIPVLQANPSLPSGGFSRMSLLALWQDVSSGLLGMTRKQMHLVKSWVQGQRDGLVLAVGDIVPLVMAWWSGARYVFVATAKSEYYWRDRLGKLRGVGTPLGGSLFYPWERWLMQNRRCLASIVRDQLTADYLKAKFQLQVHYLGNPMMDGLEPQGLDLGVGVNEWTIVMLAGSRIPEAYENFQILLTCAQVGIRALGAPKVNLLVAIASSLEIDKLADILRHKGWYRKDTTTFQLAEAHLKLVSNGFADCLHQAHFGLAMAGTATEQLVGLGKPVITIGGKGPQFTKKFAIEQARLLGCAISLIDKPAQTAEVIRRFLSDPDYFHLLVQNAQERMGTSGASARIAQLIIDLA